MDNEGDRTTVYVELLRSMQVRAIHRSKRAQCDRLMREHHDDLRFRSMVRESLR